MKIENRGGQNRKVTNNPFEKLSNEYTQYWLGMIAADGWIGKGIWLGLKELDHITLYRDWVNPNLTIHLADKHHATNRVGFQKKEVEEYIIALGITPKKSLTLKMNIPLTKHFIRGVFDGDGYSPKPGQSAKITSGSMQFLLQIQEVLLQNNMLCNIKIQQKTKNVTYALYITGRNFIKFYNFLYEDSTVYLQRKKDRLRHVSEMVRCKSDKLLEA